MTDFKNVNFLVAVVWLFRYGNHLLILRANPRPDLGEGQRSVVKSQGWLSRMHGRRLLYLKETQQ